MKHRGMGFDSGLAAGGADSGRQRQSPAAWAALRRTTPASVTYGISLTTDRALLPWRRVGGAWVERLRQWGAGLPDSRVVVFNRARWGVTTSWGKRHVRRRVCRMKPDLVLVEFAINDADIRRGISPAQSRTNLLAIIDTIRRQYDGCRVVLMTTNPCLGRHAAYRPELGRYYAVYRELAAALDLALADMEPVWQQLAAEDTDRFRSYLIDGKHPTPAACESLIAPVVIGTVAVALALGQVQAASKSA